MFSNSLNLQPSPKLVLSLAALCLSLTANAKTYECSFTEPFFNMHISTDDKKILIEDAIEPSNSKSILIEQMQTAGDLLQINTDIEISLNESGSDGMSPFIFPYQIKFGDLYGGCGSKDIFNQTKIQRIPSFKNQTGLTIVNYWPGEYGFVLGYKVIKSVKLAKEKTFKNLASAEISGKACTLKRGTRYIPSLARSYETYSSVQKSSKYEALKDLPQGDEFPFALKSGENLVELTYAAEGFCIIEHRGLLGDMFCPSNSPELFRLVNSENPGEPEGNDIAIGEYVHTRCAEGHMAWIPQELMAKDKRHFKADQDENGFH